jgi:hypothetical protein
MVDLGPIKLFLGMRILRDRKARTMTMSQEGYVRSMLEELAMHDCRPTSNPELEVRDEAAPLPNSNTSAWAKGATFRRVVGKLQHAANWTRPDIRSAVRKVASAQDKPGPWDWVRARHIVQYLKGSPELGLHFSPTPSAQQHLLEGYCDASHGSERTDGRSVSGYLFMVHGCLVSWYAVRQKSVAISTMEAEYMALSDACREGIGLKHLLVEVGEMGDLDPILLHEDNQAAITVSKNPQDHNKTKHINIRYHFIREQVQGGMVTVRYIGTQDQLADILTKHLPTPQFSALRLKLGVRS